jgi:hypothetical protein
VANRPDREPPGFTHARGAAKKRGNPGWVKGQSGNPKGRPVGSRCEALAALDAIGDANAREIVEKTIAAAKRGDIYARELILRRVWPPRQGRPVAFVLPSVSSAADVVKAHADVLTAVAGGKLTTSEGTELSGLLTAHLNVSTMNDLMQRLAALEERDAKRDEEQPAKPRERERER